MIYNIKPLDYIFCIFELWRLLTVLVVIKVYKEKRLSHCTVTSSMNGFLYQIVVGTENSTTTTKPETQARSCNAANFSHFNPNTILEQMSFTSTHNFLDVG